jgi:DnaJ-class molecular chaperone
MYNPKLIGKCSLCDGAVVTSPGGLAVCMHCNAVGVANDVLRMALPVIDMVPRPCKAYTTDISENYYG